MYPSRRKSRAKAWLDDLIRAAGRLTDRQQDAFWQLVHAVRASSSLLCLRADASGHHLQSCERLVRACALIASHRNQWTRKPEWWAPLHASQWQQFRSLLDHLFAPYPVPACMTWAWLDDGNDDWELSLYLHLAQGRSIRQFAAPFPWSMTKACARWFMQSPSDLRPFPAVRWAQVRSLGGDNRLARAVLRTALAAPTTDEPFWEGVVRFLVANGPLIEAEVQAILYFIDGQRFQPAEAVCGRGAGNVPLQPDFSIRHWSLSRLRRHMANWRSGLKLPPPLACEKHGASWKATGIDGFELSDGEQRWTIHELLSEGELRLEGRIMNHCVGGYVPACRRHRASIWSMRVEQGEGPCRVLTIEVLPDAKIIRQAKGKHNSPADRNALMVLLKWAKSAGLKLDNSLAHAAARIGGNLRREPQVERDG